MPENILKKQARDAKLLTTIKKQRADAKTERAAARKQALANAEKYFKEYEAADLKLIKDKRDAKAKGAFFVEAEPKVALLVRIRGVRKLAPKPRKIMQLLRLRQLHNATFVKLNKATWNMIRAVEPLITYGFPTRSTVQKLVYARGFGKVNRSRIPINDNSVIDSQLGKNGISCVEDLIHELWTVGPHFKTANNFLWPFKLNSPARGFEKKRHPYQRGGAWGNREENVNELIARML